MISAYHAKYYAHGRIDGGLDFEKRILQIYDTCRQPEDIEAAFNALQAELEGVIAERIKETQAQLLEPVS